MLKLSQLNMNYVDHKLTGRQFEFYIANVIQLADGYASVTTQASNDHGIDVLFYHTEDSSHAGVQVKLRHNGNVGFSAIEEVVAGVHYYDLSEAVIATNTAFTPEAIEAGHKLKVNLWGRQQLSNLLATARNNLLNHIKLQGTGSIDSIPRTAIVDIRALTQAMGFNTYQSLIIQMINEYKQKHFNTKSKMKDFYKIRRLMLKLMKIQKHLMNS